MGHWSGSACGFLHSLYLICDRFCGMNEPATADHLRKLSKQLVTAAEKRAELKAELADLKRAAKSSQITAKQRKVQQQIQRLSRRIESLIAAIANPVPRRVERWAGVMP